MSVSGASSAASAGYTPPSVSVASHHIDMDNGDWMTSYLTADDYKIGSAIAGRTLAPDANGHLPGMPAELAEIADARRRGALSATELAPASIFVGNTDSGADRRRAYIAQRDAELALGSTNSSAKNRTTSTFDYLA